MKDTLKKYEYLGLNLGDIINVIRENFTQTKPMSPYDFKIGETTFQVGPIKYTYCITIESESIEVHDDFELNFYIDIEGKTNSNNHFLEEKSIVSKSVAIFMYEKDDIPDFKAEIETHFNNHIKQLDLNKTENIYNYLLNHYTK